MLTLGSWSLGRVLLISLVLFALGIPACLVSEIAVDGVSSGSGGIGSVSVGLNPITLPMPFLAPLLFISVWLYARRRRTRR